MALFGKKQSVSSPSAGLTKPKPTSVNLPSGAVLVPVVSEKSTRLQQQGQYMFLVRGHIGKVEIKKAVESTWGVKVVGINSLNLPGKVVRRGRQVGRRIVRRHIIVRLSKGQSIDLNKTL